MKLQKSWLETAQSSKLAKQTEELYSKVKQLTDERTNLETKVNQGTHRAYDGSTFQGH